jgi:tetratricopeptide (TPR) repeat protein
MPILLLALTSCDEVGARRNIQEGNKLYYDSQFQDAIDHYNAALKVRPELAIGWYNLGLAHLGLFSKGHDTADNKAHAQGAIDAFTHYINIEKDPKERAEAEKYLISTYVDSGNAQGALDFLQAKLNSNPKDFDSVAKLAKINQDAGHYDESIKWHHRRIDMETSTDVKADEWNTIGAMDWGRLSKHPEVAGLDRLRIADEGIAALQTADGIRADNSSTLSFLNLLYRERALASEVSYARAVDTATAEIYYKKAVEIAKASQAASASSSAASSSKK